MEPIMTSNADRASAEIIQFPARGRFAVATRNDDQPEAGAGVARVAIGNAWYHDEAIRQDAERKH
jgi:hypothetical protein